MNRLDQIRKEYTEKRYLKKLPQADLEKRIEDILMNYLRFDERGMVVPLKINDGGAYLLDVFEHAFHEMFLRFSPYPAGFKSDFLKNASVPRPDMPLARQAAALLASKQFRGERIFFKFGDVDHLTALMHEGILRVSPASAYSDPSLNPATKDDELRLVTYPSDKSMPLQGYEPPDFQIPGMKILSIETKTPTNYYVFCVSTKYNPRLPVDFDKGAVLEINDPIGFNKKLMSAMKSALPGWLSGLGAVSYIDPLLPRHKKPVALFCKHFRYAYQNEVRYVWLPKEPIVLLSPIEIRMGNLGEFCELHVLDNY